MWLDDYDGEFGVYKVFRSRGKCLDYLTDTVFERAALLRVPVAAIDERPVEDANGNLGFPMLTREQVRARFGEGYDFSLALRTEPVPGGLDAVDRVTMGVREVEIG